MLGRAQSSGYRVIVLPEMKRAIHTRDMTVARKLAATITELRPDIVHTHSSKAGILGRWAAKHAGLTDHGGAVIHTIHGLAFTAGTNRLVNGLYAMAERWAAPRTNLIVGVADSMATQSLAAGIGRPGQYVTVYSGMELDPFLSPPRPRDIVRQELGLTPQDIVIGTIARLFELKGHDDLIDVAGRLCAANPNLKFLWVGNGSWRERLLDRVKSLGLESRFVLSGLVPPAKVPELIHAMDIVAHPSRREGLARALPQGQLAGKPVVTYDIDGAKEAVTHNQSGFVIPPFDIPAFGDALGRLAGDESLRNQFGTTGREQARNRFDTGVMVHNLEVVYRAALAGQLADEHFRLPGMR